MVNDNGVIELEKTYNNVTYKVISTEYGSNRSVWSAVDLILSSEGKKKKMTRMQWKILFDKFK